MDSLVARPHGQNYEHEPHNGGLHPPVEEGEDEQCHEKKSVLKKVKAKAKKIKDTLKKHGHSHNPVRDDRPIPDDHDLDQEDHDEDEEMVEDPEVHGGAAFEFAAVRSAIPGQVEELGPPGDFGHLAAMREDPISPDQEIHETQVIEPMNGSVPRKDGKTGQPKVEVGESTVRGEEPYAPQSTPVSQSHAVNGTKVTDPSETFVPGEEASMGQPRVNLERPITGLEEDPNSPDRGRPEAYTASNYQTKVTDPTRAGGEEAGVTPILQAFDKVEAHDETELKPDGSAIGNQFTSAGSHDEFSPEPIPQDAQAIREKPQLPEGFETTNPQDHSHDIFEKPSNQSSYTQTISSATSAITDKAISAKNTVASKLGYGDDNTRDQVHDENENVAKSSSPVEYGKNIATTVPEKLTPVYEKVAEAGSTVMSKVHDTVGTGTGTGTSSNSTPESGVKEKDKGVSVKEYFLEKLRPGDEDRALAEVISEALLTRKEEPEKAEMRPIGKATESGQVARQLGSEDENYGERNEPSNSNFQEKGVADKFKGAVAAVGSWFGAGGESECHGPRQALSSSHGDDRGSSNSAGGAAPLEK